MSTVPLIFSDWWDDVDWPFGLFDQNFYPEELLYPSYLEQYALPRRRRRRRPRSYYRPRGELMRKTETDGTSTVKADKDKFEVVLDVQQFKPEEINVKAIDKSVVVEGKHEERQDEHGWVSRHFMRRYLIPEQCDIDQVSSSLSSDGVLTITAPRKKETKKRTERSIKIDYTGKPAAIQEKQSDQEPMEEAKQNEEEK
ncbi:hypothetical protein KPH14_002855 [Odynerus spinipes]|uniref:SHSP domain-containing protein n=1 Tax=Odynerus spinipes TaxID=1348599 RepID=A0AAD9RWI5_9HYME|nr:hypothetical protein KPH14_002855 [Odynerus spinipes]